MEARMQISGILWAIFLIGGSSAVLADVPAGAIEKSAVAVAGPSCLRADVAEVRGVWTGDEGRVTWQLESSWGTAGFYVYRVDPESGGETRLNDLLLPVAFYESGAVYEQADPEACEDGEGTYRLEEVELAGAVLDLGVHTVVFAPPPPLLPAQTARAAKTARPMLRDAELENPGTSDVLKVLLKKEGIYGVDLQAIADGMGLELEDVQALAEEGSLCIRSQGRPVSVLYDEPRGRVVFHGEPTDNWYTRDAAYLISVGEGLSMPRRDPEATNGTAVFPAQLRFEEDRLPLDSVTQIPEDFYYWNFIISTTNAASNRVDFAISLDGYEGGALTLSVDLRGWSKTTAHNPDHHAEFSLNGEPVGTLAFDDQDAATAVLEIPTGVASNGANTLTVRGALPAGYSYSYFVLDGLTAEYDRTLAPLAGTAYIRAGEASTVSAQAFEEPLALALDEEGWYPTWIADENGELPDKAWTVSSENERFAVIEAEAVPMLEPEPAAADAWFLAETNQLDYLVIASRALAPAAQELADYRASQGLQVGVAVFEDVCDLMYDGLRTPEAIPELLSYAAAVWAEPPQMVVLAGDGHIDYLGALSNEVNHLPPMVVQTDDGFFASDERLADCGGDDLPDVAIGRLPARSAEDLTAMIAKIEAFETESGAPWQNQLAFAADRADAAGDFPASNTRLANLVENPYSVALRIDLDTMAIGLARSNLMDRFNVGTGFIHYTGHGTSVRLSSLGLLTTEDVNAMTNARSAVVVALCCLAGHYEAPAMDSLGEALMQREQGGAVAVWSSSGMARNEPSTDLAEAFYLDLLQAGPGMLGPSILQARRSLPGDLFTRDTFATYNLLGDPALRIVGNESTNPAPSPAQVFLQDLAQTYDGTPKSATATTAPAGLAVAFTYDGGPAVPTNAGSYAVVAMVVDSNYAGSATGTLAVAKAAQTIDFPAIGDTVTTNVVGLEASASSGLPVSFAVGSGPASISGGTNLSFGGTGTVSIVASQSGDTNRNAAPEVTRTFQVLPAPLPDAFNVNVRENGEGRFFVKLDNAPAANTTVTVARSTGDTNLTVKSGATLVFTPTNWNMRQAVTLEAAEDADAANGMATFQIDIPGATSKTATATELDDDIGTNLALASGGSHITGGSFASRAIDGIHMANTNYAYLNSTSVPPGALTLDLRGTAVVSRVRVLNWNWDYRIHRYTIESSLNGTTWSNLVDASTGVHQGWEDWDVGGTIRYLRLTGLSNSANALVCIPEWEVYGTWPVQVPVLLTSATNVNTRENGEGRFFIKLDRAPTVNTTVTVARSTGDADLTVQSGSALVFTPANWNTWQATTLAAAEDADETNGTATISVEAPGVTPKMVTAKELDDDIGTNLALASGGSHISGGSLAGRAIDGLHTASTNYAYLNSTNVPPGAMTLDLRAPETVSRVRVLNWDWTYRVHRYTIESSLDGTNWLLLADASAEDRHGWDDWAVADESIRYLRLTGLSNSANALVCIAEWEVYGAQEPGMRAAEVPETTVADGRGLGVGAEWEPWPAVVVTSDDGPEHTNGWAAVDGDTNTQWVGEAGAGGWHIAIGYESTLRMTNLVLNAAKGSLTDVECLYSLDGQDWSPLPGDLGCNPVEINYLWVLFPGDGTAAVPQVMEVRPQP